MSVDQTTVRRIAKLARIRISENEVPKLEGELNRILDWIKMLGEVDTNDVEPMTSVVDTTMRLRDDAVTDGNYPPRVVSNAPASEENFFMVPKVIE
ncbi:MAG: Asp-tRNA(Asn)/Glu-tRNA(Gln) amidotransferase subunit GatC [Anderseniella sp.]